MSGIVLPALVIMGILPIALQICYEGGQFSFQGHILFVPIRVGRDESGSQFGKNAVSWLRKLLSRPSGKIFLKNAYTTLKRLTPQLWIPYLKLHILTAGNDPANIAVIYGAVGTVLERLQRISSPRVRKTDLRADVDFQRSRSEITACVRVSLHLYQALWSGLCFAWGFWRDYRRQRKRSMSTDE